MIEQDYSPPQHVMDEWRKACGCCPLCSANPCDAVAAGGACDDILCQCNDDAYAHDEAIEDE